MSTPRADLEACTTGDAFHGMYEDLWFGADGFWVMTPDAPEATTL